MLSELVRTGVASPLPLGTPWDLTQVKLLIDAVNSSFMTNSVRMTLEGHGAGKLRAQDKAPLLSWGGSSLSYLEWQGKRRSSVVVTGKRKAGVSSKPGVCRCREVLLWLSSSHKPSEGVDSTVVACSRAQCSLHRLDGLRNGWSMVVDTWKTKGHVPIHP